MTEVRTVAAHEVVRATFPREVTERDAVGMAAGKAIDTALSELSHRFALGRGASVTAMDRLAGTTFRDELDAAMVVLTEEEAASQMRQITGVIRTFRTSPLLGLGRPKSRLIVIDERYGVYAQPDYWDGRARIFEMKSFHADPIPPDVDLQLRIFQLAFPGFQAFLAEFDRRADPVRSEIRPIPVLDDGTAQRVLRIAESVASAKGVPRVLEYVDSPTVRYALGPRS